MKHIDFALGFCGLALALGGCVENRTYLVTEAVGPSSSVARQHLSGGSLIVYSAWDGLDTLDVGHLKHTPYAILSENGVRVERVRNRCGSFDQDAMVVHLPAGSYRVEAKASSFGSVVVPIQIKEGQTTVVYLDGTTKLKGVDPSESDFVKLPNGQIVGWHSTASIR
jgi:hypothetical protein